MEEQRYAPPRAAVADIVDASGGTQPVRLWPARGRLGRLRLFVWNVGLYIGFFVVMLLLGFAGLLGNGPSTAIGVLSIAVYAAYAVVFGILIVQRSHDMDRSGWWGLLVLIPLVYFYWQFKAGTPGPNRWGPPPEPNTPVTRALGWVFGILGGLLLAFSLLAGGIAGYAASRAAAGS